MPAEHAVMRLGKEGRRGGREGGWRVNGTQSRDAGTQIDLNQKPLRVRPPPFDGFPISLPAPLPRYSSSSLGEGAVDDVFLWSGICLEDERDKKWDGEGRKC